MSKQLFCLVHDQARSNAILAIKQAPDGYCVEVKPKTRTLEQNSRLWAMLSDISRQDDWYGKKLDSESWKCVFSAALKKQDVVPNLDGSGFVVLGQSTSKMTIPQMTEMQELISAFAVDKNVVFAE